MLVLIPRFQKGIIYEIWTILQFLPDAVPETRFLTTFRAELKWNELYGVSRHLGLHFGEEITWQGIYSKIFLVSPDYTYY